MSDIPGDPGGGGGDVASADHGGRDAGIGPARRQAASFPARDGPDWTAMQIHGSCACRDGDGVLLIGPPGAGKSDLVLRLLARGFDLVADDRVEIADGIARPCRHWPACWRCAGSASCGCRHVAAARLALVVELGDAADATADARRGTTGWSSR